jgi:tetratricopeptide (TPR) repeat protein
VLEELLRAVASGAAVGEGVVLPGTVLGLVQARLDAFGGEARRVLSAASVFGQSFAAEGVEALLGAEGAGSLASWLEILTGAEVIFPRRDAGGDGYLFRHALLRDAAYDLLPDEDRQRAHLRAGAWLEESGEPEAIVLVEHFERGGDRGRAAHFSRFAAAQALDANDLAAAVARAERGVRCGARGETLGQLRLLEAQARFWRGQYAEAEEAAGEARLLCEGGSRFAAATALVGALGQQARYDEVEHILLELLAVAPAAEARREHLGCALRAADYLLAAGRYDVSERAVATLLAGGRAEGGALAPTLTARARELEAKLACHAGDQAAGVAGFQAALRAFEAAGDQRSACELLCNVGVTLGELGLLEEAEEHLRRALATAERLDLQFLTTALLMNLALVLCHLGHGEEARPAAESALALARQQGDRRFQGAALLALASIAQGEGALAAAEAHARAAVAALGEVPPALPLARGTLARALLAQGRTVEALAEARAAHDLLEALGRVEDGEALVRLVLGEALAAAGEEGEARAALARAAERLGQRAAAITRKEWQESFLRRLPDHARTLALASQIAAV